MELPKFLIADNSAFEDALFVVHTEYPRFILNVSNDEVHWFEEFDKEMSHKRSYPEPLMILKLFIERD